MDHRRSSFRNIRHPARWIQLLLAGAIAIHILLCIVLASVPPVSRDALTHHLVVPKIYLQKGSLGEIPEIGASYYPQNLQLLYILPLYFGNDIVPKYIHFAFALLTAWLIFRYLRQRIGSPYALFGALLFLSLPIIIKLSVTVYVDLGLIFFSTAALMLLFRWIDSGFQNQHLVFAAVCCGLALGTKYNALISLLLLTLFVPIVYIRKASPTRMSQLRAVGAGLLFCAVALLVFSPWMVRNAAWTGNPVHPLFPGFFSQQRPAAAVQAAPKPLPPPPLPPRTQKISASAPKSQSPFWIRKHIFGEQWWQTALIPVRIFFAGRDDNPRTFDGKLNPLLFLLPWFAFIAWRSDPVNWKTEKLLLLSYALLFFFISYFRADMRIRYISPITPPLVILSAFGLKNILDGLYRRYNGWRKHAAVGAICLIVAAILGLNYLYTREQFVKYEPFGYISGRVGRDAYITRYRPAYPVVQYANVNLAANAKILAIFQGRRRYYSERNTVHSVDLLINNIARASTAKDVFNRLRRKGFTHLLINVKLFKGWAEDVLEPDEIERLNLFFSRHTKPLFSEGGYVLLELRSTPIEKG